MGWKEFVASVVSSLAWPVAGASVAFLLRKQIRYALERPLRSLQIGPLSAEWIDNVGAVVVNTASGGAQAMAPDVETQLAELKIDARRTPVPAVMRGFALVEREVNRIAAEASVASRQGDLTARLLALRDSGTINDETAAAVQGLVTLRNLAAHDNGSGLAVTPERSGEYIALVEATLFALRRVNPAPSPAGTT